VPAIAEGLAKVRDRIARAAEAASRAPASVRLVAVSKTKPAAAIREAYEAGQRDFGENYAQELAQKAEELADLVDLRWHFIGHLQSNKARMVAPVAHLVHTVDSASLATELAKRAKKAGRDALDVLVEVNVGGEAQKHGATAAALGEVVAAIAAAKPLRLRGLMTMPPHDLEGARRAFEALASLQATHGGKAKLPELSMGMSDDLEVAIASGATIVRVGTAIFGAR
jgi:pyridoxal phosphate enzyme (YggS family)